MAAAIKPYLHKVELKIKPYLQEGPLAPYWQLLENKTKAKREHIALGMQLLYICLLLIYLFFAFHLGLLALLAIYLAFGWANDFLCNLLGFIYPAYAS